MKYLGKISYGLYVYHYVLIFFAGRIQDYIALSFDQIKFVSAVVAFPATILVAALSFKFIERPILGLKDKYFPATEKQSKKPAASPAEPV
jgi:peptidoglycan/LPS O-acetylase OafA/YrhL